MTILPMTVSTTILKKYIDPQSERSRAYSQSAPKPFVSPTRLENEFASKPLKTKMSNEQRKTTVELISSLISLSHSTKVFAGKWQPIRNNLDELRSGLTAGDNPSLSDVLPAVTATVKECRELARRCVDLSYSGKLLMQSDLDVTLGKLEAHVKTLSEIHKKGIFINGYAVVVSKPCLGASKEDIRFYLRDLFTRIKVGDFEMKKQSLINLYNVVLQDDKYVMLILQVNDFINVLVDFIGSHETEIQEESVKVVSFIAGFDSCKGVLIAAGVIAPLIRVLECGSELGKVVAASCLCKFTENSDNAWSVSAHGGVTTLLKICECVDSKGELVGPVFGVLRNLAGVEEIKRFIVEEGAVSTIIKLVRSKDEVIQVSSVEFIQSIAFGDELVRQIVIREGGVRALLRVLDPKWTCSSKTREVVMRAIESLCFSSPSSVSVLIKTYGFVNQLLYYVRNGEVSVQETALKVAFRLCGISEEAKKALGDAGFMAELVKFLSAKSFHVREMAAEALSCMVMVPKNRKKFVQDDENIALLLQLLDPEEGKSSNQKSLISILMSLTSCNSGRKKIVSSEHAKNIERLVEAEVSSDAKRLVRKLSTNRFRSMLNGIWHT